MKQRLQNEIKDFQAGRFSYKTFRKIHIAFHLSSPINGFEGGSSHLFFPFLHFIFCRQQFWMGDWFQEGKRQKKEWFRREYAKRMKLLTGDYLLKRGKMKDWNFFIPHEVYLKWNSGISYKILKENLNPAWLQFKKNRDLCFCPNKVIMCFYEILSVTLK